MGHALALFCDLLRTATVTVFSFWCFGGGARWRRRGQGRAHPHPTTGLKPAEARCTPYQKNAVQLRTHAQKIKKKSFGKTDSRSNSFLILLSRKAIHEPKRSKQSAQGLPCADCARQLHYLPCSRSSFFSLKALHHHFLTHTPLSLCVYPSQIRTHARTNTHYNSLSSIRTSTRWRV